MNDELNVRLKKAATQLKTFGAKEVYVFGSVATGTMHDYSDIDLAVSGIPPEKFFSAMGAVEETLDHRLDLVDLDEDTPFVRYLKEEKELVRVD